MRKTLITVVLAIAALALIAGIAVRHTVGTFEVALPATLTGRDSGALVTAHRIGDYPAFAVQKIIDLAELPEPLTLSHGMRMYCLQYRTTNHDGAAVTASGLVAIPKGEVSNGVIAYFHGTNAQRNTAPSQPGIGEGLFVAAAAAGQGHVLLAPDYIGLGESREVHPYLHATTTVATVVDFLTASHAFVNHMTGQWPPALYLTGFSQGGHATFLVQRALEELNDPRFDVRAAAPIAGPFHLRDVSFPQAMTGETDSHVFYLAYLAHSYAFIYGQRLDTLLNESYAENVPILFDGDHEPDEISGGLPEHPRDLFQEEFLKAYDGGAPNWFLDALAKNGAFDWTPSAPVRVYYGDNDVDVHPEEARRVTAAMRDRGATITAISVGPYNHNDSALRAIPRALQWFDALIETVY